MANPQFIASISELKQLNALKAKGSLTGAQKQRRKALKKNIRLMLDLSKSQEGAAEEHLRSNSGKISATPPPRPSPSQTILRDKPQPQTNRFAINSAPKRVSEGPARSSIPPRRTTSPRSTLTKAPSRTSRSNKKLDLELKHISKQQLQEVLHSADKAIQHQKQKLDSKKPKEIEKILQTHQNGFTQSDFSLGTGLSYYGSFLEEGYEFSDDTTNDLKPIHPNQLSRQVEKFSFSENFKQKSRLYVLNKDLSFWDDFTVLYEKKILPVEANMPTFSQGYDPNFWIKGRRKTTVHLLNGQILRGKIRNFSKDVFEFKLEVNPRESIDLNLTNVKAIFIHNELGDDVSLTGQTVSVTFKDQRKLKGLSPDYQTGVPYFTLSPENYKQLKVEAIVINVESLSSVN